MKPSLLSDVDCRDYGEICGLFNDSLSGRLDDEYAPERALLRAILIRAIRDYTRLHVTNRYASQEVFPRDTASARSWLYSKLTKEFSFIWICEHLELDPETVLTNVERLRKVSDKEGGIHRSTAFIFRFRTEPSGKNLPQARILDTGS